MLPSGGVAIAKPTVNINQAIRVSEVRVIGADGEALGIIPVSKALELAEQLQLDLVEVSPTAVPPVCRIMDYGKFKYQQSKKLQEAKKSRFMCCSRKSNFVLRLMIMTLISRSKMSSVFWKRAIKPR